MSREKMLRILDTAHLLWESPVTGARDTINEQFIGCYGLVFEYTDFTGHSKDTKSSSREAEIKY